MSMTYEQLVDEFREHTAEELVDLSELARHFAIQHRREEIRKNADESMNDYLAGNLAKPTSDIDELWRQIKSGE